MEVARHGECKRAAIMTRLRGSKTSFSAVSATWHLAPCPTAACAIAHGSGAGDRSPKRPHKYARWRVRMVFHALCHRATHIVGVFIRDIHSAGMVACTPCVPFSPRAWSATTCRRASSSRRSRGGSSARTSSHASQKPWSEPISSPPKSRKPATSRSGSKVLGGWVAQEARARASWVRSCAFM